MFDQLIGARLAQYVQCAIVIILLLKRVHNDMRLSYAAIFKHGLKDVQGRKSPAHADFKGRCGFQLADEVAQELAAAGCDTGWIKAPAEAVVSIDDTLAVEPVDCCANSFASRLCRGIDCCHGAAGSAVNCHHSKMSACIVEFNRLRPKNCLDGLGPDC